MSDLHYLTHKITGLILLGSSMSLCDCKPARLVEPAIHHTYKSNYLSTAEIRAEYNDCFTKGNNCDRAAVAFSFIGETELANVTWDLQSRQVYIHALDTTIDINHYFLINSLQYLDSVAQNYRAVMINEAHHRPECRVYTTDFLTILHKKGYNYLGLEGLQETGDSIHQRGFPSLSSGYYIREPQYANLIRVALKSGYRLFAYDHLGGRGKQRELHQATEIYRIFQQDTSAKVLVHAGWGHVREDTAILGGLMAHEFKQLSNIDPLTINQTRYIAQSSGTYENPLYLKLKSVEEPGILVKKSDRALYQDDLTDIALFQPRKGMNYYIHNDFLLKKVRTRTRQKGLLMAIPSDEDLSHYPVPAFVKEISAADQTVQVHLPLPGTYSLYLLTADNMFFLRKFTIR